MTQDPQFELDADLLAAGPGPRPDLEPQPEAPAQAAPVVVVQYRNRGVPPILLFPITLILSLGMFAAYHYLFVAPRQRELQDRARVQAREASAARDAAPAETASSSLGLSLNSQPLPPEFQIPLPPPSFKDSEINRVVAKPVDPHPIEAAATRPPEADAPTAGGDETDHTEPRKEAAPSPTIGFSPPSDVARVEPPNPEAKADDPPPQPAAESQAAGDETAIAAVAAVAAPDPKPSPTREEMMRALQAEAEANRAARAEQNLERDQARAQVEDEAQDRVESERRLFHDGLRRILSAGGPTSDAGQRIDELCDQFGRTYEGDLKAQVLAALSRYHGKLTRDGEVNMLRSLGVPEAGVLDFLANNLHRSINSRNGPHTPDAVRVLAAKQLLRIRLPSNAPRGGPSEPTHARRTRPASNLRARPAR